MVYVRTAAINGKRDMCVVRCFCFLRILRGILRVMSIREKSDMARPFRIEYDGALYHITSRGNDKKPIFKDEADRQTFLDILKKVTDRYNWLCHAYC